MHSSPQCFICSTTDVKRSNLIVENRYALYTCLLCGLGFLDLRDESHEDEFDEYWDSINEQIYANPQVVEELKRKYSRYFGIARPHVPNNRLLDVGSGSGISVHTASSRFQFEATGLEPSKKAVSLSKRLYGISVVCDLLRSDSKLPRDFGLLTLWDVIEHLVDPAVMLRLCHNHLTDSGVLMLETPDEGAFVRRLIRGLAILPSSTFDFRSNMYYRAHRYYFTRRAMQLLLERCGFTDVQFFSDYTMFEKEILKKRLYSSLNHLQEWRLRGVFGIMRSVPLFRNKMIVLARCC